MVVNPPRNEDRATVSIASTSSSSCRHWACSAAGIWVTSAPARYPIADFSVASASLVLENAGTVLTWVVTSLRMLEGASGFSWRTLLPQGGLKAGAAVRRQLKP